MLTAKQALFQPLNITTAPDASKPILENIQKSFGFIPNLMATFANSPTVLQGYLAMDGVFERGTFSPIDAPVDLAGRQRREQVRLLRRGSLDHRQSVFEGTSRDHRRSAGRQAAGQQEQNALVNLVREIVRERGFASPATVEAFLASFRRI